MTRNFLFPCIFFGVIDDDDASDSIHTLDIVKYSYTILFPTYAKAEYQWKYLFSTPQIIIIATNELNHDLNAILFFT